MRLWLLSPRKSHRLPDQGRRTAGGQRLGNSRVINLPGISVTVGEMVAALERVAGSAVAQRIEWSHDPAVDRIVSSWPGAWDTRRAQALGFCGDASFDDIIRAYIADELQALPA